MEGRPSSKGARNNINARVALTITRSLYPDNGAWRPPGGVRKCVGDITFRVNEVTHEEQKGRGGKTWHERHLHDLNSSVAECSTTERIQGHKNGTISYTVVSNRHIRRLQQHARPRAKMRSTTLADPVRFTCGITSNFALAICTATQAWTRRLINRSLRVCVCVYAEYGSSAQVP